MTPSGLPGRTPFAGCPDGAARRGGAPSPALAAAPLAADPGSAPRPPVHHVLVVGHDPAVGAAVLDGLRRIWPAWVITRGPDLLWRARHRTWPEDVGLAASGAGTLYRLIEAVADVADTRASSDPLCLGCVEELKTSPEGWRAKRTGLLTCTSGLTPDRPHTTTLPGSRS